MKIQEKTGKGLEARLDEIAGRLRRKEITVPTDLLGAALFLILAALIISRGLLHHPSLRPCLKRASLIANLHQRRDRNCP